MKVQTNPQTTNPPQTNPQSQQPQNPQLQQLIEEVLKKYLQQLHPQNPQPQQPQQDTDEFIIKSGVKASYIALKLEQLLSQKNKITVSMMGFTIPIGLDAVMLVRKDLEKVGKKVSINSIEIFEKEVFTTRSQKKVISGLKITLSV